MTDSAKPESIFEVVRNRKTGKLFLILDDSLDDRYQLITPSGDTKILPSILFEGDPVTVKETDLLPEQVEALRDRERRLIEGERITEERQRHQIETPKREPAVVKTPRRRSPKQPERGPPGVMSTWKSDRLTFYRHKISPLKFNQKFRIEFYNGGIFEISKGDFESAFNDVVMSPSYRSEGHFSYPEIPEKARKFFKK